MSEIVRWNCTACGKPAKALAELAGRRVKCSCGQSLLVPGNPLLSSPPLAAASASQQPATATAPRSKKWPLLVAVVGVVGALGAFAAFWFWPKNEPMSLKDCYIDTGYSVVRNNDTEKPLKDFVVLQVIVSKFPYRESPKAKIVTAEGIQYFPHAVTHWVPGEEKNIKQDIYRHECDFHFVLPKKVLDKGGLKIMPEEDFGPQAAPVEIPNGPRRWTNMPYNRHGYVNIEEVQTP